MSIEAMMWVKKHAPTKNATEMCILYALADRANDDGTGCWPYYETLADESRCSVPTIKRHIKELEIRGVIVRGDQSLVSQYPNYRRPVVWDLNLKFRRATEKAGSQSDTPPERGINGDKVRYQSEQSEVSNETKRGITVELHNHPLNHPVNHPSTTNDRSSEKGFDEFWEVVPKKVGKQAAKRAWMKAIKKADPSVIIAGMERYRDDPNRSEAFTKNPQGWLNDGRWEDDPLPSRNAQSTNTAEAWLGIAHQPQSFGTVIDGDVVDQKELAS